MRRITCAVVLLLLSVVCFSACNTIEGVGKDIKRGGAAIEKSAK